MKAILADMNSTELVVKIRPEVMGQSGRGRGFKSHAGLNFFSGLIFTTSSVVFIAARIAFIFVTSKYFLFIGCLK